MSTRSAAPRIFPRSTTASADFSVGQFDDTQLQLRGFSRNELVADGGQRDAVELAGDGHSPLLDRPQGREPVADREEPVFRGGVHIPDEGVLGDGVMHGAAAHPLAVDEQWNAAGH